MPAAINNYKANEESLTKFDPNIHDNILNAYIADMGKYSNGSETLKVQAIYKSMPDQLAKENKKFKYSVVKKGSKASQYGGAMEWLLSSKINLLCKCINNPDFPLSAYYEKNIFKLYMSDVGLLNRLSRIPYKIIIGNEHHLFKGAIAENYVATELKSSNFELYYYKRNASEVDFIIQLNDQIIPIEVKANNNTRSRSLNMYIERYKPSYAIRISSKNFGFNNGIKSIPLYSVYCLRN
jgi:predicted AAA+ superfamily ATPase